MTWPLQWATNTLLPACVPVWNQIHTYDVGDFTSLLVAHQTRWVHYVSILMLYEGYIMTHKLNSDFNQCLLKPESCTLAYYVIYWMFGSFINNNTSLLHCQLCPLGIHGMFQQSTQCFNRVHNISTEYTKFQPSTQNTKHKNLQKVLHMLL